MKVMYNIETGDIVALTSLHSDAKPTDGNAYFILEDEEIVNSLLKNTSKYKIINNQIVDNAENISQSIRIQRNLALQLSDVTQLPDYPLTPSQKESWAIYRQALRDYPSTITDPLNPPPLPPKPF